MVRGKIEFRRRTSLSLCIQHDLKPSGLNARPPRISYSECPYTSYICYNIFLIASTLVSRNVGQIVANVESAIFPNLLLCPCRAICVPYLDIRTHRAEFSEFFLCIQRGTQLHSGNRLARYICWEGTKFIGRIDGNSLASNWLLEKK